VSDISETGAHALTGLAEKEHSVYRSEDLLCNGRSRIWRPQNKWYVAGHDLGLHIQRL